MGGKPWHLLPVTIGHKSESSGPISEQINPSKRGESFICCLFTGRRESVRGVLLWAHNATDEKANAPELIVLSQPEGQKELRILNDPRRDRIQLGFFFFWGGEEGRGRGDIGYLL